MFRLVLSLGLALIFNSSPALLAQFPGAGSTSGGEADAELGFPADTREWEGPLVPLSPTERQFFRTFCVGRMRSSASSYYVPNSVIVGLEISFSASETNPQIHSLCPIYDNLAGERVIGKALGVPRGNKEQIVGKAGYAVSGVLLNHQDGFHGVTIRFSRLLRSGSLDLQDSYSSPAVGRAGGTLLRAGNLPFYGMFGWPNNETVLDGVAFLVSQKQTISQTPELIPKARGATASLPLETAESAARVRAPDGPSEAPRISPELAARLSELLKQATQRLVLVQGGNGKGSGFIYQIGGKPFCATNQHVVAGNTQIQFLSLAKGALKVGEARAASGHDLLVASVPDGTPAFEAMSDITKEVAIGDPVVVLGDPEGAGVVRPIAGRVLGIGPQLIEVSAEFVEGNSGSPIVHLKTGKVVGIASYAMVKAFDMGAGQMATQVRRFGYRLDSVQTWQPVNWPIFQAEAAAVTSGKTYTEALYAMLEAINAGAFAKHQLRDPRLQQAFARLPQKFFSAPTPQQQTQYIDSFVREMRTMSKLVSDDLKRRLRYDYFQRDSETDAKMRDLLLQAFDVVREKIPMPPLAQPFGTTNRRPGF